MKVSTMKRLRVFLAPLLLCVFTAGVLAQSGGGFNLTWSAVPGGGGTSAGGSYTVQGAIGQHDVDGPSMRGGKLAMRSGFWAPPEAPAAISPRTYLPLIMR
ncbi:MAG TPA: hypothetical protein VL334_26645 [Anaerolineae bacterium]|nr:hypothetical protein [Anaerolineae bacterium]